MPDLIWACIVWSLSKTAEDRNRNVTVCPASVERRSESPQIRLKFNFTEEFEGGEVADVARPPNDENVHDIVCKCVLLSGDLVQFIRAFASKIGILCDLGAIYSETFGVKNRPGSKISSRNSLRCAVAQHFSARDVMIADRSFRRATVVYVAISSRGRHASVRVLNGAVSCYKFTSLLVLMGLGVWHIRVRFRGGGSYFSLLIIDPVRQ